MSTRPRPRPITPSSRDPLPGTVGYRIPEVNGERVGGIEVINGDLMLAHDAGGVYVLLAARVVLHLSPDEAERMSRVLGWHADRARLNQRAT